MKEGQVPNAQKKIQQQQTQIGPARVTYHPRHLILALLGSRNMERKV